MASNRKIVPQPSRLDNPQTLHDLDWTTHKHTDDLLNDDPRYEIVVKWLSHVTYQSHYDLGCGSGVLARKLKAIKPALLISGCDISEKAIARCTDVMDRCYYHDIDKGPLPEIDNYYDVVTALDVIEHLYNSKFCMAELARITRPGGRVIVSVPNFGYAPYRCMALVGRVPPIINYNWDPRHVRAFSLRDIRRLFDEVNLCPGRFAAPGKFKWPAKVWPTFGGRTLVLEGIKFAKLG